MNSSNIKKWDANNMNVPKDKKASSYAVEREKQFVRGSGVLDLGGATGIDSLYFVSKGHHVTVVDISGYALEEAQKNAANKGVHLKTVQVELGEQKLPFEDNNFDVVYSRLVAHYFSKQSTCDILADINRVLRPGGKAYITVKSPNDEKEMQFLRSNNIEIEPSVFTEGDDIKSRFTIEQLEEILKQAEIQNFEAQEYTEDLSDNKDKTKSGNKILLLNEITWTKSPKPLKSQKELFQH